MNVPPVQTRCVGCGASAALAAGRFRCAACGEVLEAVCPAPGEGAALRVLWRQRRQGDAPLDRSGVWRFREALPVPASDGAIVSLAEGNTPLYELPRLAARLGVGRLLAKHQGLNPTGSFKDRGMTVAVSRAREEGFRWVACASTGNTSASMAAYAARAGLGSLVLVPEGQIAWGKLAQALEYGALTCQLATDFDGCARVLDEVVRRAPVYLVNSVNPLRAEGQKTAAIEMLEQLGWEPPDHVIAPGGNLANSSAWGKALLELREWGFIARLPRVSVIQAAGANPLARSWRENRGERLAPVRAASLATAIRIGQPASWRKATRVLAATRGTCAEVSEAEIALAKAELGAEGIACEPASAATLAGLKRLITGGQVGREESVVLVLTGHGLKDAEYTLRFHQGALPLAEYAAQSGAREAEDALARRRHPPVALAAEADAVLHLLAARGGEA